MDVSVTNETQLILDLYDADDLLKTIPRDYQLNMNVLNAYKRCKAKAKVKIINIDNLSQESEQFLKALSSNYNIPVSLIFNFLIEIEAKCNKAQPKRIKEAVEYYNFVVNEAAINKKNKLFLELLNEYEQSIYFDEHDALFEGNIANFLVNTIERTKNNEKMEAKTEMKKITISVTDDTHEKIKDFAEKDRRSIARYVQLWLTYIANCPYSPAPTMNPEMERLVLKEEN